MVWSAAPHVLTPEPGTEGRATGRRHGRSGRTSLVMPGSAQAHHPARGLD